jgi:EmrB/QacA subfamily drug resistance transporter
VRERLRDPAYAHARRWVALGVVSGSLLVIGVDNTVLNIALPTLARSHAAGGLGASGSELQWIVDSYTIVFAGLLLTAGSLGDRFGRYRALTFGLVLFGIGSALSAQASSAGSLIATRSIMGIGAAFIMPATLSIITNVFTQPSERARAIGVWAGIVAIGIGFGPVIGGFLLEHFWWGSVFLVNVPIVIAALILGWFFVPDSRDESSPRLDPLGSVLSIIGLATFLWAIIEAPSKGWLSTPVLGGFAVSLAVLGAFMLWELRYPSPMLDVRFFENPRFSAASAAITIVFIALFGMLFLLTQYLQSVLGYSTVEAGAVLLPMSAMMMIFAPRSPRLVARFGNKLVVAAGMSLVCVAFLLMTTFGTGTPVWQVIVITMVNGFGMAHVMAPATDSIMGSLPRAKAGVGSAMNDTTRQVGGAFGVALLGSIAVTIYSSDFRQALRGVDVPRGVLEHGGDSVGAALGTLQQLPAHTAARVSEAAHTAFVHGFHVAVLVGAAVVFVGVLSVLRWLPARARDVELDTVPAEVVESLEATDSAEEAVAAAGRTIEPSPNVTP